MTAPTPDAVPQVVVSPAESAKQERRRFVAEVRRALIAEGPGAHKRLAERLGETVPSLQRFLKGRPGALTLTPARKEILRAYIEREPEPQAAPTDGAEPQSLLPMSARERKAAKFAARRSELDRLDQLDQLYPNDTLIALGKRIRVAEEDYRAKDHSARVQLGILWWEARQRFDTEMPGGTWKSWVDHYGGGRSASDVRKLIGIAKDADPEAKAAEVREAAAGSMAATREKRSNVGSPAQAVIETAKAAPERPVWDSAPAMPTSPAPAAPPPAASRDEWYTPSTILDPAREVLGDFHLDPASCDLAQEKVQARRYFTKAENGLEQDWTAESVWLNPPFSDIASWVSKLIAEYRAGLVTSAILLANNGTCASWFHAAAAVASALCFPRGRIPFYGPDGETGEAGPRQGQVLFHFGQDASRFVEVFGEMGYVAYPARLAELTRPPIAATAEPVAIPAEEMAEIERAAAVVYGASEPENRLFVLWQTLKSNTRGRCLVWVEENCPTPFALLDDVHTIRESAAPFRSLAKECTEAELDQFIAMTKAAV